jgi:hypothetical protein
MSKKLLKGFNGQGLYAERAESDHLGRPFTETYLTKLDQSFVLVTARKTGGIYSLDRSFNILKEQLDSAHPQMPVLRVIDLSTDVTTIHDMKSYDGSTIKFGSPVEIQATNENYISGTKELEYSYGTGDVFTATQRNLNNAVYAVETITL